MANVYEDPANPDARQEGNIKPSRFRPRYRKLTDEEVGRHDAIKSSAILLEQLITDYVPDGREKSLAMTKLEESIMWAVKGLTA